MIRLHKDDRELLVRIDLDAAPSAIEKSVAMYEQIARIAERDARPEVLEAMKLVHGMVLLLVTQLLADTCTEKAAERADRADNPEPEPKGVVH